MRVKNRWYREEEGLEDLEFDESLVQNFTLNVEYILKSIVEHIMKRYFRRRINKYEALIKASALTQVNKETLLGLYKAVSQQSREDLKRNRRKGTDNVLKRKKRKG